MVFTTAENPCNRNTPRPQPGDRRGKRHRAADGSWWETTGELRIVEEGEHALTPLGVSRALHRTRRAFPILRPVVAARGRRFS